MTLKDIFQRNGYPKSFIGERFIGFLHKPQINRLFTPFKNTYSKYIYIRIHKYKKLKTIKNIWIHKQSYIKCIDEENTSLSRKKKTSGPLKHHVTQIQQLRGKLQVFNISNR